MGGADRQARRRALLAGRSRDWLKLKCVLEQEFVIGGYTEPPGAEPTSAPCSSATTTDGRLRYAGKVGTGYSAERLAELGATLRAGDGRLAVRRRAPLPRGTHWVRPELVAQIGFAEWTTEGRLRQPRFLGLRDDKRPAEVVRERASEPSRRRLTAGASRALRRFVFSPAT